MTMLRTIYVDSLGIMTLGLAGWRSSRAVLAGEKPYEEQTLAPLTSRLLPANERRRSTRPIRLAIQAAEEAFAALPTVEANQVYSVFASSGGDYEIIHKLCTVLSRDGRTLSPTHFHNSVHNAPAGYWTIATGCLQPSLSLSVYDGTFAAGLMEAATQAIVERVSVLLVAYDDSPPFPLSEIRSLSAPFAVALVISPDRSGSSMAGLTLELTEGAPEAVLDDPALEHLRTTNPAARSLSLLCAIAKRSARQVILPYLPDCQLSIGYAPC